MIELNRKPFAEADNISKDWFHFCIDNEYKPNSIIVCNSYFIAEDNITKQWIMSKYKHIKGGYIVDNTFDILFFNSITEASIELSKICNKEQI